MGEILLYTQPRPSGEFKINYPYYGLFGSADITAVEAEEEVIYKCKLLNGTVIFLKKNFQTNKWLDASLDKETALSTIMGGSIDDFLKTTG